MKKKKLAIQKLGKTFVRSALLNGIQGIPGISVQTSDVLTVVIPGAEMKILETRLRKLVSTGTSVICPRKRIIKPTFTRATDMNPRKRIIMRGRDIKE